MRTLTLLFLLLLPLVSAAQAPIAVSGSVLDAASGEPIPGANVVVSGTQTGAAADLDGRFTLRSTLVGDHVLIVSAVGYETVTPEAVFPGAELSLRLTPVDLGLGDAVVEREDARAWRRQLARLKPLFVGESPLARRTEWINPEVLDLEETLSGSILARAEAPLVLENEGLGYRLTFLDLRFRGDVLRRQWEGALTYEEMEGAPREQRRWARARQEAYDGSWRHFVRALATGSFEEEGFLVFPVTHAGEIPRVRRPISEQALAEALIVPDSSEINTLRLRVYGAWMIEYSREEDARDIRARGAGNAQRSWITLERRGIRITRDGQVLDPLRVVRYGYWDWERVGDLLPLDYRPPEDS